MSLPLFNPFARYVVIRTDVVHYPGEYGYSEREEVTCPVHYTDELNNAENVCYALGEVKEGRYQVCENAAWKALDKRRATLKATGYGDAGELPGIDTQLGIAAEVLHDMLEPPSYPEETVCATCGCNTGSFTKELCDSCKKQADARMRKCAICGVVGCLSERTICGRCDAVGQIRQRPSGELYNPTRDRTPTALERVDAPDTPTAKPEGSAVWAKIDK